MTATKPQADRRTRAELLAALVVAEHHLQETRATEARLRQRLDQETRWRADDWKARQHADAERRQTLQALLTRVAATYQHVLDARFRLPLAPDSGGAADALARARQEMEAALALPNLRQLLGEAGLGATAWALVSGAVAVGAVLYGLLATERRAAAAPAAPSPRAPAKAPAP